MKNSRPKIRQTKNHLLPKIILSFFFSLAISFPVFSEQVKEYDLQNLLISARKNNLKIRESSQEIPVGEARLSQAGLFLNPAIESSYTATGEEGEYSFSLLYSQPLEFFGQLSGREKIAGLDLEINKNKLKMEYLELENKLKREYLDFLLENEYLKLNEQILLTNEKLLKLTERKFQTGEIDKANLNLIRLETLKSKIKKINTANQSKNNLLKLKISAGIETDQEITIIGSLTENLKTKSFSAEEINKLAQAKNIEYKNLILEREIAGEKSRLAESLAFPIINFFGKYQQQRDLLKTSDQEVVDEEKNIGLGFSFPLPFFNRNQGNISEFKIREFQAEIKQKILENQLKSQINQLINKLETTAEVLSIYQEELLPLAAENHQLAQISFNNGEEDLTKVFAEQNRLIEVKKEYLEALKEYHLAVNEIEKLTNTAFGQINGKEVK